MPPLEQTIDALSKRISGIDSGALAELRRMEPGGSGTPIFWRLASELDLAQTNIATWQQIIRIMAILSQKGRPETRKGVHEGRRRLGSVLCDGGDANPKWGNGDGGELRPVVSEKRLGRLLALPPHGRGAALERLARQLARTRDPDRGVNCVEIALLLLAPKDPAPVQALAREYYARLDRAAYQSKDEGTA